MNSSLIKLKQKVKLLRYLASFIRCKTILHLIDITVNDIEKAYNQVKNELISYSPELIKKKELIVLNKIDLVEDEIKKEIINDFSKKINGEILLLSTLDKDSVSKVKAKLISYVS